MAASAETKKSSGERAEEDLFHFAIDREDTKALLSLLPEGLETKRHAIEYELQILKIITVGWGISFCLADPAQKIEISERYWNAIGEFAHGISSATGLMIGQNIDYFQVLKDRLDTYVAALANNPAASEPAAVIGPEFARICSNQDDAATVLTGAKMFKITIAWVRQYLATMPLI